MNSEEDEFQRIESEAKRRAAHELADTLTLVYQHGYDDARRAKDKWVSVTDKEISAASKGHITRNSFARAVEKILKDKNK